MGSRRWVGVAFSVLGLLALGCGAAAKDATLSDATPRHADSADARVAAVYTTFLRFHIAHGLPLSEREWNGVLYLPSSTRDDAHDPMSDPMQPGDEPVSAEVQEQVKRDLADVADVRWVDHPREAALAPLGYGQCAQNTKTRPLLVWMPPVEDGSEVELRTSSWAGCGLALGSTYVVSEDDGTWTTSTSVPMWVT